MHRDKGAYRLQMTIGKCLWLSRRLLIRIGFVKNTQLCDWEGCIAKIASSLDSEFLCPSSGGKVGILCNGVFANHRNMRVSYDCASYRSQFPQIRSNSGPRLWLTSNRFIRWSPKLLRAFQTGVSCSLRKTILVLSFWRYDFRWFVSEMYRESNNLGQSHPYMISEGLEACSRTDRPCRPLELVNKSRIPFKTRDLCHWYCSIHAPRNVF